MYNSRPHLYYPRNYYLGRLLVAFIAAIVPRKTPGQVRPTNVAWTRRRVIVTLVICFVVLELTPIGVALYRNYRWERNQPPTTLVPDLVGLDLPTATERARSAHLGTQVLGQTWYTNLSPGLVTLQSPEAGQRVSLDTDVGLELAIPPPAVLAPKGPAQKPPH